jgi:hypothetical protein
LPEFYHYRVVGPDGDSIFSLPVAYESGICGEAGPSTLGRFGLLGHVADLRCIVPHLGGAGVAQKPCMLEYPFEKPGTDTVEVSLDSTAFRSANVMAKASTRIVVG